MHFDTNFISSVRSSEMEIHCLSVRIWQNHVDGLRLNGHGTIKQNKFGTLFLEMVCPILCQRQLSLFPFALPHDLVFTNTFNVST